MKTNILTRLRNPPFGMDTTERLLIEDAADHIAALEAENAKLKEAVTGWQPMETAPMDGKHCILAVQRGPFVYAIQGAYMNRKWLNAADIDCEPLCWMPSVSIPGHFLPWNKPALT